MRSYRQKIKRGPVRQPPDILLLTLSNPVIYTAIIEYIITFRLVSWKYTRHTPEEIQLTYSDVYLNRVLSEAKRLILTALEIGALKKLVQQVMGQLVADPQKNSAWATNYLVTLYRDKVCIQGDPFLQVDTLQRSVHWVATHLPKKKDISSVEWKQDTHNNVLEQRRKFMEYMPLSCQIKQKLYMYSHFTILIMAILATLSFIQRNIMDNVWGVNKYSMSTIGGFLSLYWLITFLLDRPIGVHSTSTLLYCPFPLKRGDQKIQLGLLAEISDAIDTIHPKATSVKRLLQKKTQQEEQQKEYFFTENEENYDPAYFSEKIKKTKKKKITDQKDSATALKSNINVILASAKLAPLLNLVWHTRHFGDITTTVGKVTKNIYPVWSLVPGIHASCQFYFVYFPVDDLKLKEDKGMIEECTEIIERGRVVAPQGHAGIVWEDHDTLKIKMLKSGQGLPVTGKPAEWRHSLKRLQYPSDLFKEPPRVEEHTYQLFAPDHLCKTH